MEKEYCKQVTSQCLTFYLILKVGDKTGVSHWGGRTDRRVVVAQVEAPANSQSDDEEQSVALDLQRRRRRRCSVQGHTISSELQSFKVCRTSNKHFESHRNLKSISKTHPGSCKRTWRACDELQDLPQSQSVLWIWECYAGKFRCWTKSPTLETINKQ